MFLKPQKKAFIQTAPFYKVSGGGGGSLTMDGYAVGNYAAGTCTLTTGGAGDIIVALGYYGNGLVNLTDTAGLTWNTVLNVQLGSYYAVIAWAYSSAKLTNDVITSTGSGLTLDAVAVAGGNHTTPIDATGIGSSVTSPFNITTTTANSLVISACSPSTPPATAGSGFTLLDGGSSNYFAIEYQNLSASGVHSMSFGSGAPADGFAVAIVS